MRLDKAIEILTDLLCGGPQYDPDDRREAVKLAIEALVHLQALRDLGYDRPLPILPGEPTE
ncbi:MAG: hypothetical protein ACLFVD_02675 [Dehalococcoidia bacterium]